MKIHEVKNATRKAIAMGRRVQFYRRKPSSEHFVNFKSCWFKVCKSFDDACRAADAWVNEGEMI